MDSNTLAIWEKLETRLNVSFRQNMVDLVLEMARNRTTDPKKIADWMVTTSTCICNAIFGTDDPMPLLSLYIWALENQYPVTMQKIDEVFTKDDLVKYALPIPEHDDFIGILWAAGSSFTNGEFNIIGNELNIKKKGLQRFQSIWEAPIRIINNPII